MRKKTLLKKLNINNEDTLDAALYRGKDKDGKWVYGALIKKRDGDVVKTYIKQSSTDIEPEFGEIIDTTTPLSDIFSYNMFVEVDSNTVGQYTGFNYTGVCPFFTGDIVRTELTICGNLIVKYFVILFDPFAFRLKELFDSNMTYASPLFSQTLPFPVYNKYEIMGNIYDVTAEELDAFKADHTRAV